MKHIHKDVRRAARRISRIDAKTVSASAIAIMLGAAILVGCGSTSAKAAAPKEYSGRFSQIISELDKDKYYAVADAGKDGEVLLVADEVYDYNDGQISAIAADIYDLDENGNAVEAGSIRSAGTAYPIAEANHCLMYGSGHHMGKVFVEGGNIITREYADEIFDEKGNVTYSYYDLDRKFEGEVESDTDLRRMFNTYNEADKIIFQKAE